MAYKEYGPPTRADIFHFAKTLGLELGIPNGKNFVYDQDLGFQMCRYRKSQTHIHTAAVMFNGRVQELFHFGEGDDFVELPLYLCTLHS